MNDYLLYNYSNYTIPNQKLLLRLVEDINDKIITISVLKSNFKEIDSTYLIRLLFWMNKFDIIDILISKDIN